MKIFLLLGLFPLSVFAGVEKLLVENLNMEYTAPYGVGTVERVGIGMSLDAQPYAIELRRVDNAYEIMTPFWDFTWSEPSKFVYEIEKLSAVKTSLSVGGKNLHSVEGENLMIKPKTSGPFIAQKMKASCQGDAQGEIVTRVMGDCLNKMAVRIKKVEIPDDFFLFTLLDSLPRFPNPDLEFPGDNVIVNVNNGKYSLELYLKYWFYAGLRSLGHIQFENNHQTLAIRIDQVKFGYLNITNFVMKRLEETVKHPSVKIDPPWVRIDMKVPNEIQSY